ncbi:MAG: phage portal protein family protein [Terriglobia bacterium]
MKEEFHNSSNGRSAASLLGRIRALRAHGEGPAAPLRSRIDRALRWSDRAIGLETRPTRHAAPFAPGTASWAPLQPVTTPAAGRTAAPSARPEPDQTLGLSGTPITSGYLLDLGEYNAELMGRNAIPVYEKMRRGDAQVRATLLACKLPILSAKWEMAPAEGSQSGVWSPKSTGPQPPDNGRRSKEIAAFVRENLFGGLEFKNSAGGWVSQSWHSVISNALLMLDFGCAVHEDVWTLDGDRIRLRSLPARLPVTFYRWHTEEDGETLLALEQYGYRREQFLNALLPADKVARFTYQQEGANFWGIALQRAMYPHWYVKSKLYRIDAIANERNALGIPVFRLAPGFAAEDRAAAYSFVTQIAAHEATGLVEPPGDAHTGLRIAGYEGNLRDVMPSIQHHNEMISRVALATFMDLGSSEHGSRALGATATDFFMLGLEGLAHQIAAEITQSTIRRLTALNFGDEAPCPRLFPANVQARSVSQITADLVALAQQGLVVSEKNIRKVIRERFALPEESDEGIVAVRGETVAQAAGTVSGRGGGQIDVPDIGGDA